jgi:aminotransferase EvaB
MTKISVKMFDYREQYLRFESEITREIHRVFRSGELILGAECVKFEKAFSNFLGLGTYSVAVANGTDALFVCLTALGVRHGHEVITVANTAVPTVSAIRMAQATPVFVDVDPTTALMSLEEIEARITSKTRAIIPVHLFGNAVDMPRLLDIARHYDLAVIEDCAQANGTSIVGELVGTFGHAAAFSFYPTKNLGAYGDAGLCATSDRELAKEMQRIRRYGFDERYYSEREGINSRLDEIQAVILNLKLRYFQEQLQKRRSIAQVYLAGLPEEITPLSTDIGVEHSYHLFVVRTAKRDHLRYALADRGIQTGIHYPYPIHRMRGYEFLGYGAGSLPVTEALSNELLSLPLYPELPMESVDYVIKTANEIVG